MASVLKVDKLDPQSGTALEIGTSGDTVTVPTGAGLTVTDEVKTNKISPATGAAFALGDSGDTFTVPSGATIVNSGTATGFGGGIVLQAVQDTHAALCTITTATWTPFSASFAVTITPASTDNDILLLVSLCGVDSEDYGFLDIQRAISGGTTTSNISGVDYGMSGGWTGGANRHGQGYMFLDSPSTTSAITYSPTGRDDEGSHWIKLNRNGVKNLSSIIAMEIEG